jgi:hypothetical protein
MMNDFLSEKEIVYCRTENEENNVMVSWHGSGKETVCVNHFFIGNKVSSWKLHPFSSCL